MENGKLRLRHRGEGRDQQERDNLFQRERGNMVNDKKST